jgi:hypothetical protein
VIDSTTVKCSGRAKIEVYILMLHITLAIAPLHTGVRTRQVGPPGGFLSSTAVDLCRTCLVDPCIRSPYYLRSIVEEVPWILYLNLFHSNQGDPSAPLSASDCERGLEKNGHSPRKLHCPGRIKSQWNCPSSGQHLLHKLLR